MVETGLHSVFGAALQACNVCQGHVFHGPEHQAFALQRVAKAAQAVHDAALALLLGQLGRGLVQRIGGVVGAVHSGAVFPRMAALQLAQPVDGFVARQGEQPGVEGHPPIKALGVAPDVVEHIHGDFIGQGVGVQPTGCQLQPGDQAHLGRPGAVQAVQRAGVAAAHGGQ